MDGYFIFHKCKKIDPSAKAAKVRSIATPSSLGSKEESAVNTAKEKKISAFSFSDSTITIEDLLGKVNEIYSDILPGSVANHFGNIRRETKLGEYIGGKQKWQKRTIAK